jgi:hypothetical protein
MPGKTTYEYTIPIDRRNEKSFVCTSTLRLFRLCNVTPYRLPSFYLLLPWRLFVSEDVCDTTTESDDDMS